jgi:hypothetical protein
MIDPIAECEMGRLQLLWALSTPTALIPALHPYRGLAADRSWAVLTPASRRTRSCEDSL